MILTADPSALLYIDLVGAPIYNRSTAQKYLWFKQLLESRSTTHFGCYNKNTHSFTLGQRFLGIHTCSCGAHSTSCDVLLPNRLSTNTLAYHYLTFHTTDVPDSEWQKLVELRRFVEFKIETTEDPYEDFNHFVM